MGISKMCLPAAQRPLCWRLQQAKAKGVIVEEVSQSRRTDLNCCGTIMLVTKAQLNCLIELDTGTSAGCLQTSTNPVKVVEGFTKLPRK